MAAPEHQALVEVLRVGLSDQDTISNANPPVVILRDMAQEWQQAGMGSVLSVDKLDLILMARLVEAPPVQYPLHPIPYLLSCFQRVSTPDVSDVLRKGGRSDADVRTFQDSVEEQLTSMVWLALSDEQIIPQPPSLQDRGALQLLDALWLSVPHEVLVEDNSNDSAGIVPLPRGFLSRSLSCAPPAEFTDALRSILFEMGRRAHGCSILGDHNAHVQAWICLLECKPLAKAIVSSTAFLPEAPHGRAFQRNSALAALMGISFLVDTVDEESQPSVRQQCLDTVDLQNGAQVSQVIETLQAPSRALLGALTVLFSPKFLLSKDTRADVLKWIAAAMRCDSERTKMHVNDAKATSDGFMYNLNRVLLHLCGPFTDFYSGKARQFINLEYLRNTGLLQYDEGEARLAATAQDFKQWVGSQPAPSVAEGGPQPFHFITECFFMTAYSLHLGVVKLVDKAKELGPPLRMLERLSRTGDPLARMRLQSTGIAATLVGIQCALQDTEFQAQLIQWCQLVSAWLVYVATGTTPGQVTLPLSDNPPPAFQMIPEHIVSDMASLLTLATIGPDELNRMDDVILACTALMGSPSHVTNPYLRYTLCTVLYQWIPDTSLSSSRRSRRRNQPDMEPLFTMHPGVASHLVPALFELYKDVEYTDRGNQFYEKFSMRTRISELLEWLWTIPAHLETWRSVARGDMHPGLYLRFLNNIVNDSIYLLDEAMKLLPEIKDKEAATTSPEWAGMSSRQQQDHMRAMEEAGNQVKFYLQSSDRFVSMLVSTSADLPRPLLADEMVGRIAQMLNYFLRHLVGPDRGRLSVKNPQKYDFDPKKLLGSILAIFVHVAAADSDARFATAIAEDTRSYRPENFTEASAIAAERDLPGFSPPMHAALDDLADVVQQATVLRVQEDDELIQAAPDEFVDPIMSTLMRDPVILPSSQQVIDRPNILRHLMTDPRDPINRAPLQASELIPATELKEKIHKWIAERRAAKGRV
eukprot:jgi/Ulvmu1/6883/UM031_0088.1